MGGDTPPEEDVGCGEDDTTAEFIDPAAQDQGNISLSSSSSSTKKKSPQSVPKTESAETAKALENANSSTCASRNVSNGTNSHKLDAVGGSANVLGKKASNSLLKHSKSYDSACGVGGGAEGSNTPKKNISVSPSVAAVISSSSTTSTTSTVVPASSSQRQVSKRSKDKGDSTTAVRSRGNRQPFNRVRAHSGSGEGHNHTSPSSSIGVASIKVSSSASAVGAAVGGVTPTNSPRKGRKEDGWKEVGRR